MIDLEKIGFYLFMEEAEKEEKARSNNREECEEEERNTPASPARKDRT